MYAQLSFISLLLVLLSCNGQEEPNNQPTNKETIVLSSGEQQKIILPENGFYCGFLDSKGILWFGSLGSGIFQFDGNTFHRFTMKDGLSSNEIACIIEDSDGNILFGTSKGIDVYNGEQFSQIAIPQKDTSSLWLDKVYPVVNPNQVMSLLEDGEKLWIGTNGAGVYRYNGEYFEHFLSDVGMHYEDQLQHNIVLSMTKDLSGNIWFSSLSHAGVSKYDGESFTHYVDELSDDFVRYVFCDKKGTIWVGTHGNHDGGLDSYDGTTFQAFYKTDDGFNHNNIRMIFEDTNEVLWMASGTTPLSLFDGAHFTPFTSSDGEQFDKIIFVVGDSDNNIWFGNRYGLWKFDGSSVMTMLD